MLREQVRAAGCPKLRGFLQRLRSGEQTEEEFEQLRRRLYKPAHPTFADGLRAITPLNQDRWNVNMAAVVQTGPLCTPAFAVTDQKSQGKQFSQVLLNLKGVHASSGTTTRPSFMSLYVQLSRAERWDGLYLFRKPARSDFIEPRNVLDEDMWQAVRPRARELVPDLGCDGGVGAVGGQRALAGELPIVGEDDDDAYGSKLPSRGSATLNPGEER
ncbi:hypothetical protein PG999_004583 [Apiospora kogelbergensis]|uniref:Uncharacterized protein n=1 Tax=Apiospora kogelbergensis TaxID=1337665 RepID=A0AAW0QZR9_9PEZI